MIYLKLSQKDDSAIERPNLVHDLLDFDYDGMDKLKDKITTNNKLVENTSLLVFSFIRNVCAKYLNLYFHDKNIITGKLLKTI